MAQLQTHQNMTIKEMRGAANTLTELVVVVRFMNLTFMEK